MGQFEWPLCEPPFAGLSFVPPSPTPDWARTDVSVIWPAGNHPVPRRAPCRGAESLNKRGEAPKREEEVRDSSDPVGVGLDLRDAAPFDSDRGSYSPLGSRIAEWRRAPVAGGAWRCLVGKR